MEQSVSGAGKVGLSLPHQHSLANSTPAYWYFLSLQYFLHLSIVMSPVHGPCGRTLLPLGSSKHWPSSSKQNIGILSTKQTGKLTLFNGQLLRRDNQCFFCVPLNCWKKTWSKITSSVVVVVVVVAVVVDVVVVVDSVVDVVPADAVFCTSIWYWLGQWHGVARPVSWWRNRKS